MTAPPSLCDSCGDTTDDLTTVRRLYITPEDWDTERQVRPARETEAWCYPCRTMYPHETPEGSSSGGERSDG